MSMMGLLDNLKHINWQHESSPGYEDFAVLPLLALFFFTVRFLLDIFVFEKLGSWLLFGKGNRDVEVSDRKKKLGKFKESAWKFDYLSAEILALSITYDEPWFTNTIYFLIRHGKQAEIERTIHVHCGLYMHSIFALIFWEIRRSDLRVSMGHHVATLILIVLSYMLRFALVGSIVLAFHDASDIFLEVRKMPKYQGVASVRWLDGPIYYYTFNTLLICLLVLHIYWWVLMYRMLVKQIQARGQLNDDVRSDSEGEEELHEGQTHTKHEAVSSLCPCNCWKCKSDT